MVAAGWALPAVLMARAAVGLGEGVVLPSMSNLMATRVPTSWRASALGFVYSGFHSGAQLPVLASVLCPHPSAMQQLQCSVYGLGLLQRGQRRGVNPVRPHLISWVGD